jgi:hypothetical protein
MFATICILCSSGVIVTVPIFSPPVAFPSRRYITLGEDYGTTSEFNMVLFAIFAAPGIVGTVAIAIWEEAMAS